MVVVRSAVMTKWFRVEAEVAAVSECPCTDSHDGRVRFEADSAIVARVCNVE